MKLYDFHGSSSAFRVRIALNLKGISYHRIPVDLLAGDQLRHDYRSLNPMALVPALIDRARAYTESLAIIEYLDETHPRPPLLPESPEGRTRVRALALSIASGIQPLHTERTENFLADELSVPRNGVLQWCQHWVNTGMTAVEACLNSDAGTGKFCHGDSPTLADVVLVPQVYAAKRRFDMDLRRSHPTVWRIYQNCMVRSEFRNAAPSNRVTTD
jgi:maleylacetoacetate isomerase